jgi:hypothetical protein
MNKSNSVPPIYGTTPYGTELIFNAWLEDNKMKDVHLLISFISVNKPDTKNNTPSKAKETIEKWFEDNF